MAIRLRWVDLGGLRSSCACLFSRAPNWLHRMKAKAAVELGATRMIRGSISTLSRGGRRGETPAEPPPTAPPAPAGCSAAARLVVRTCTASLSHSNCAPPPLMHPPPPSMARLTCP